MGGWQDHVELLVEWGSRGHATDWDAVWDTDVWNGSKVWSGSEPQWHEFTDCELDSISIDRGRSAATESFKVGTGTISLVLNEDVTGEPVPGDRWSWRSELTIGDEVRVQARLLPGGTWYPLYRGDVRSIADRWSPFGVHLLTINATDILGRLGRVDPLEREPTGAGDHAGTRMGRIADLALIPYARRRFDTGIMTLQATNFARNLAGEAEVTAASEGGDVFADSSGRLVFRQRAWWQTDPRASEVRQIWANQSVPDPDGAPVACPETIDTRESLELLANIINYARAGGTVQTSRDTASMSLFGPITYGRSDLLCETDTQVASLAAFRVAETGQRTRIIDGVEINPLGDPNAWPGVVDLQLGDLHRLYWDDGEATTDLPVHVQGIRHRIGPLTWQTSLTVWDRYGYTPASGWDVDVWNTALWAA